MKNFAKIIEKLEKSPIIGTCAYQPPPTQNSHLLLIRELTKSIVPEINSIHNVRDCEKWIKCKKCGKIWCCSECAIEDGAITGLKQYRKSITCLKCLK